MSRVENPGLQVAMSVKPVEDVMGPDDAVAVRVDVTDAATPLRVSIYVDGDLVDTWVPAASGYEFHFPGVRGRHLFTARAIDARGRWGATSTLYDLSGLAELAAPGLAAALPV
jgi:hypothetical protein